MLASFRWIFRLNASGTRFPIENDSFSAGNWLKQEAKSSIDRVCKISMSCSTAARKVRRKISLHFMASLRPSPILLCCPIQVTAWSIRFSKWSASNWVRRLRLYN